METEYKVIDDILDPKQEPNGDITLESEHGEKFYPFFRSKEGNWYGKGEAGNGLLKKDSLYRVFVEPPKMKTHYWCWYKTLTPTSNWRMSVIRDSQDHLLETIPEGSIVSEFQEVELPDVD